MVNKKIKLCNDGKISIRNDGIVAKQTPMTMQEARLLRLVIMQVSKMDEDFMEYEASIFEIVDLIGGSYQNIHNEIKNICERLASQKIAVRTGENWSFRPWMALIEYRDGKIKLALNKYVKPYVIEFDDLFTQYEMNDVMQLKSYYALRIYEILKMKYTSCYKNKNIFDFTIEELREMTSTENKFKQTGIWRLRVIDIAEQEINEKTDLIVHVEPIKKSRKYIGFRFKVSEKEKIKHVEKIDSESQKEVETEAPLPGQIDLADAYRIKELLDAKSIPCSIEQAEQLFLAYDSEISEKFENNLEYVAKNKNIKSRVAYLLKMAKNNVAVEREISRNQPQQHKNNKKGKANHISISKEREQAYVDLTPEFATDLWPDMEG